MRILVASLMMLAGSPCAFAAAPVEPLAAESPVAASAAIDRGLAFLARDAAAWKAEHNCVSCHHAALVVWAMQEAKAMQEANQQGYTFDEAYLAELTTWIAESGPGKTSLPRPESAPRALNTKPVYFALGLGADKQPDETAQKGMQALVATMLEDQLETGAWAAWPETRPPFFFRTDQEATTLVSLALSSAAEAGDEAAKVARDKGLAWLLQTPLDDDPQSIAMRLVLWQRVGRPQEECAALVQTIVHRQNADGGWSQTPEMASDVWGTGQALYALSVAGRAADDPVIRRGRAFLVTTQKEDGSWPMTSRPIKPGNTGAGNLIPITGGGSAWGIIGLARSSGAAR